MYYLLVCIGHNGSIDDWINAVTSTEDEINLTPNLLKGCTLFGLLLFTLFIHHLLFNNQI